MFKKDQKYIVIIAWIETNAKRYNLVVWVCKLNDAY